MEMRKHEELRNVFSRKLNHVEEKSGMIMRMMRIHMTLSER